MAAILSNFLKEGYYCQTRGLGFRLSSIDNLAATSNRSFRKVADRNAPRGTWDIMARILSVCSEQRLSKYQLMVKANLNTLTIEKYLDILFPAGLIVQQGVDYFQASDRGRDFLLHYKTVKSLMEEQGAIEQLAAAHSKNITQTAVGSAKCNGYKVNSREITSFVIPLVEKGRRLERIAS